MCARMYCGFGSDFFIIRRAICPDKVRTPCSVLRTTYQLSIGPCQCKCNANAMQTQCKWHFPVLCHECPLFIIPADILFTTEHSLLHLLSYMSSIILSRRTSDSIRSKEGIQDHCSSTFSALCSVHTPYYDTIPLPSSPHLWLLLICTSHLTRSPS